MARYTKKELNKFQSELEGILERKGYLVHSGKGRFQPGQCRVHKDKRIVINKFAPLKYRINFLVEKVKDLDELSTFYIKPVVREKIEEWSI
ncbi:MAG: hypothetical protein K9M80_03840 [Candidatus Marinimicrobia bacterium]|nr:hypothetical protein [Candidatus Neomarinimicrobiota bacterium]